ncbi:MAG: hypothetical protein K8T90_00640 [Planctomycetes bacterium]|nr:hypothetical protein [Planctomycetota bacterium]
MEKKDLSATSWMSTRLSVFVFALIGVFFVLRPPWLGWDALASWLGGEVRLVSVGVGIAFVLIASLTWEKDQLRVQSAELMEALNQLLYGENYQHQREAIEILLNALDAKDPVARRAAHENLVRLTGQNFADDAAVWRAWWEANKKSWAARRRDA